MECEDLYFEMLSLNTYICVRGTDMYMTSQTHDIGTWYTFAQGVTLLFNAQSALVGGEPNLDMGYENIDISGHYCLSC